MATREGPWTLTYEGFEPAQEGLREALCTVGNGAFATRGAAPESTADGIHYPGTYIAGCFDRLTTTTAGREVENEDMVNAPNWLPLSFRVEEGLWFALETFDILSYRQSLDLLRGVLDRRVRVRDPAGRVTTVTQRRFVHMELPHLAGLHTTITAENWSGRLHVRTGLDGAVQNRGVARYGDLRGDHLVPVETTSPDRETLLLQVRTRQSNIHIAVAARTRVWRNGEAVPERRRASRTDGLIRQDIALDVEREDHVTIEKIVALHTSRDPAISEPLLDAHERVERALTFDQLLRRHALAWERLWSRYDVAVRGGDRAQLILRVHLFHVLQTLSENTVGLDVGVPARGLHGEAYRGHIFWDELFILPLITLRLPVLTRSLLEYRYRRLEQARLAARRLGLRGATFPWQSGSNGREETQTLHLNPKSGRWLADNSRLQRHVNVAIAFNVWHYVQVTRDTDFLRFRGAPIILEIARFWASLAKMDEATGRFAIRGVMGPDEYHDAYPGAQAPGIDNNAYTNVMVAWTMCRALELLEALAPYQREELIKVIELDPGEPALWEAMSRRMTVPFHADRIISQFQGYDDLLEFDWTAYMERYGDIQRLDRILEAEGDSTNRYKVSKQADVLMLFYLLPPEEVASLFERLGYEFDVETDVERNIEYYLQRTSHGSTLSRIVHAWVLARFDRGRSWDLFSRALESDIADVQGGTTAEGVHLGAMAGTVDLIQRCYAGVEVSHDVLWLRPAPPPTLPVIRFGVHYRGHRIALEVADGRLTATSLPGTGAPIRIGVHDQTHELDHGQRIAVDVPPTARTSIRRG